MLGWLAFSPCACANGADSNADSNGTQFVGIRDRPQGCRKLSYELRRAGHPRMPTDVENDTGGQVVAGSNPVSPTSETGYDLCVPLGSLVVHVRATPQVVVGSLGCSPPRQR